MSLAYAALCGYLLGSLAFGVWCGRLLGIDLRRGGSGNPGATNVQRLAGWRAGLVVLLLDMAKGAAAVLLARALWGAPAGLAAGLAAPIMPGGDAHWTAWKPEMQGSPTSRQR